VQEKINAVTAGFGGGTRIATSIADFQGVHARAQLNRSAQVWVLSDGFDADEPQQLAEELAAVRSRGARITWFHPADQRPQSQAVQTALETHANGSRVMILRDYHAENLMHLPARMGLAQVGLLDFQLAQMGQACYDLVSLLQDARRDVSPATQVAMKSRFLSLTGELETDFAAAYVTFGAQRALRILGIFAQLCTHQGKPQYLPLIPRVWQHLQQNLAHPALNDLAKICARDLPQPTPAALQQLRSKCQTYP
jgi:aminoglycoside/choline kinase family phosphotransferase